MEGMVYLFVFAIFLVCSLLMLCGVAIALSAYNRVWRSSGAIFERFEKTEDAIDDFLISKTHR